ncbi:MULTISPECIES: YdcF family protein [unclassified Streptomyces]|uniref:YdcF family protein n=1 Tax=unclassified Streptomyces TaxID=2593676 RepID=UPI00278BD0ED|nr:MULTISPECIES: YdcF family protein [unclassified Streptomyces]
MRRTTAVTVTGLAGVLAWGEWLNRRWSRALVGEGDGGGGSEVVVVLGFRNARRTANLVNRWRVRAGVRSAVARDTRLVFSGGAVGGDVTEARLMARYARSVLAYDGAVVLEEASATTWENVSHVIPLVEHADRIKVVSQPAHALKARAYLRRQRPDLAERLVRADDYRPGEWLLAKPVLAVYGLWTLRGVTGARSSGSGSSSSSRPDLAIM